MITTQQIKDLRDQTQCPMMECKKALVESAGDFDAAKLLLRQKLGTIGDTKESTGQEGLIILSGSPKFDPVLAQISTDTDFTAKNDTVIAKANEIASALSVKYNVENMLADLRSQTGENIDLVRYEIAPENECGVYIHFDNKKAAIVWFEGDIDSKIRKRVAMHVVAASPEPKYVAMNDVPDSELEQERLLLESKAEGKPEVIRDKIVQGGLDKYRKTLALLEQPLISDPKITIAQFIGDAVITKFVRWQIGE